MSQINPFASSILQAPLVQRQQTDEKDHETRQAADRSESPHARDIFEHQVESSEELTPIHDQPREQQRFKRPTKHKKRELAEDEDQSHLDLKA